MYVYSMQEEKDKVKDGLVESDDLIYFFIATSVTSVLSVRHCRVKACNVCTFDSSYSANLMVKGTNLLCCYFHALMLAGRRKPQKLVFYLS